MAVTSLCILGPSIYKSISFFQSIKGCITNNENPDHQPSEEADLDPHCLHGNQNVRQRNSCPSSYAILSIFFSIFKVLPKYFSKNIK